jgi:hypothetical protein
MKMPLVLVTAVLLTLCPPAARADIVHFGNFAPGTTISVDEAKALPVGQPTFFPGGGGAPVTPRYSEVAFTTGATPIEITSVDLALQSDSFNLTDLQLLVTTAGFPSFGPALVSFSTLSLVPATSQRVTFTANSAVTLEANTTYHLQVQSGADVGYWWMGANNTPAILSNYAEYNLGYGSNFSLPNQDRGAYYITAVTAVPEAGASALVIAGGAVLAGLAHRLRRRKNAE